MGSSPKARMPTPVQLERVQHRSGAASEWILPAHREWGTRCKSCSVRLTRTGTTCGAGQAIGEGRPQETRKLILTHLALAALAARLLLTTRAGREPTLAPAPQAAEAQGLAAAATGRRPRALLPVVMHQPTPAPTPTSTATGSTLLVLTRPVSAAVPLYHVYGFNPDYEGVHPGYDYGFLTCDPIDEPIIAMGAGIVLATWVDEPLRPGHPCKNGTVHVDYGIHRLADGRIARVVGLFDHIVPIVSAGAIVHADTHVADFSTCERYGCYPELEIQIFVADPAVSEGMTWQEFHGYVLDLMNAGNRPHIDPMLAGLAPQ